MAETFTLIPEFEFVEEDTWRTIQTPFEFGYVQARAVWPFPKRIFRLHWDAAFQPDREYIASFFRDHRGPAIAFDYQPVDPIGAPYKAGSASQVAGGSMGARTYFFVITWVTASGETTKSAEGSFSVSANNLFKLTIPKFQWRSITKARVYAGTVSGTVRLQAEVTTSGGSWTEPTSGLDTGSAFPPTVNTAKETVSVHLLEDNMPRAKLSAVSYRIDLAFEEMF